MGRLRCPTSVRAVKATGAKTRRFCVSQTCRGSEFIQYRSGDVPAAGRTATRCRGGNSPDTGSPFESVDGYSNARTNIDRYAPRPLGLRGCACGDQSRPMGVSGCKILKTKVPCCASSGMTRCNTQVQCYSPAMRVRHLKYPIVSREGSTTMDRPRTGFYRDFQDAHPGRGGKTQSRWHRKRR
jgi:hypothetical protein